MKIYQLHITLKGSKPKIWRRILVTSDTLLSDFHKIIQTSMGWMNFHLHQFIKGHKYYTTRVEGDDTWDELDYVDYKKIKLSALLKKEGEKITYEYDFGDGWLHEIALEKILPPDPEFRHPVCLKGKNHCPPEDVGGVYGYELMLEILKNPDHEEYESTMEWLSEEFNPLDFDIDEVNEILKTENYGFDY